MESPYLQGYSIRFDRETREWIVKFYDENGKEYEPARYFGSDREDAINTAKAAIARQVRDA